MNDLEKIINDAWENKDKVNKNSDKSLIDAINQSSVHKGKELIHVRNKKEFYEKVLIRFGDNVPSLEEFIEEWKNTRNLPKYLD